MCLIGTAQSGTTYSVIYGVIGRATSLPTSAPGPWVFRGGRFFGQFLMVPTEGWLIRKHGLAEALVVLGGAAFADHSPGMGFASQSGPAGCAARTDHRQALREACANPSFQMLMAGYFVCGFQVVFIGVHMPSYLKDQGLAPQVASYAPGADRALFNVGTHAAGSLGQRWPKRHILAFIYLARSVASWLFLLGAAHAA